jgi:hypothetical protein
MPSWRATQSPSSSGAPRGDPNCPAWTSSSIARLRYVVRDQSWTLQWRDRNGRWHRHADANPTDDGTVLLNEIDEDPTGIFWG